MEGSATTCGELDKTAAAWYRTKPEAVWRIGICLDVATSHSNEQLQQTNFMELSLYWEAGSHTTSQDVTAFVCNLNFHFLAQNNSLLDPTLSHVNSLHTFIHHLFHIYYTVHPFFKTPFNIIVLCIVLLLLPSDLFIFPDKYCIYCFIPLCILFVSTCCLILLLDETYK